MVAIWLFTFITLVIKRFEYVQAHETPLLYYEDNDLLEAKVYLFNIPPGVDSYTLTIMEDSQSGSPHSQPIKIKKWLHGKTFKAKITLKEGQRECATNVVIEGELGNSDTLTNNPYEKCKTACDIHTDFHSKCEDHPRAGLNCKMENNSLTCYAMYNSTGPPGTLNHTWYQDIKNAEILSVFAGKTYFKMDVYKFDVGTTIYSKMAALETEEYSIPNESGRDLDVQNTINFTDSEPVRFNCAKYFSSAIRVQIGIINQNRTAISTFKTNEVLPNLTEAYNGTTLCCVSYTMNGNESLKIIQRNVSDMSTLIYYSRTVAYSTTPHSTQQQNGTDFPSSERGGKSFHEKRPTKNTPKVRMTKKPNTTAVKPIIATKNPMTSTRRTPPPAKRATTIKPHLPKKTTNVPYKKELKKNSTLYTTTTIKNTTNKTKIVKVTGVTTTMKNMENMTSTIRRMENMEKPTEILGMTENSVSPQTDKTKYYYATAAVGFLILIVLIVYLVVKKCHRKSSEPQQGLELETYATSPTLYAELKLNTPANTRPVCKIEENYAEIVGVLKPPEDTFKKF